MPPGAHQRIARARLHHLHRLRLAVHLSHNVAVGVRGEVEALVLLRPNVYHGGRGQDGLPQVLIAADIGQKRTGGGQFGHWFAPVADLQRKDESLLLPSVQVGPHPILPGRRFAPVAGSVPRDAKAPAALQPFADGGEALRQAFIRIAFQMHDARARNRAVHKPRLRPPVIEGLAAGQRIDQRGGGTFRRNEGVRRAVAAVLVREARKQMVAPRTQRHAAIGGRVPSKRVAARLHRQVLAQRELGPRFAPDLNGQLPRSGRFHGDFRRLVGTHGIRQIKGQPLPLGARAQQQACQQHGCIQRFLSHRHPPFFGVALIEIDAFEGGEVFFRCKFVK